MCYSSSRWEVDEDNWKYCLRFRVGHTLFDSRLVGSLGARITPPARPSAKGNVISQELLLFSLGDRYAHHHRARS